MPNTEEPQYNPFAALVVHYVNHLTSVDIGEKKVNLRYAVDQKLWVDHLYNKDPLLAPELILERADIFQQAAENYAYPPLGNLGENLKKLLAAKETEEATLAALEQAALSVKIPGTSKRPCPTGPPPHALPGAFQVDEHHL